MRNPEDKAQDPSDQLAPVQNTATWLQAGVYAWLEGLPATHHALGCLHLGLHPAFSLLTEQETAANVPK